MTNSENLSFIIKHKVKPGHESKYEAWLKRIVAKAATHVGHQGANIIRPTKGNSEYVIVIHFTNLDTAKAWIDSEDRKNLVKEISDVLVFGDKTEIRTGIDFWFTPDDESKPLPWKQWLITTCVIAPLTMLVPFLLSPIFSAVPVLRTYGVSHVINASVIVAIVTFIVMPRLARALHSWLFKK